MSSRKGFGAPAANSRNQIATAIHDILQASYDAAVAAGTVVSADGIESFPLLDHPGMRSQPWWRWCDGARSASGAFFLPEETFITAITGQR